VPARSYIYWPTNSVIPLQLELVDGSGAGITGATPEVSIRRYKETATGGLLDLHWWNGTSFQATAFWHPMTAIDDTNNAGLYNYLWGQNAVGLEHQYIIHYRHTVFPVGFATELHTITNEVYIPRTQPDPVIVGPQTIMGQLELVKGLLHHNSIVDNHTYDGNGNLLTARVRVFDDPGNVPSAPGGSETTGLIAEFAIDAAHAGPGVNTSFRLTRVLP